MATLPYGFGVIGEDSTGRVLTPDERAKIIAAEIDRAPNSTDEYMTPDGKIVTSTDGKGDTVSYVDEDVDKSPLSSTGSSDNASIMKASIGALALVILGIIFIVLAILNTDTGKAAVKTVATRGMA